jgi:hypothetical protein
MEQMAREKIHFYLLASLFFFSPFPPIDWVFWVIEKLSI